MLKIKSLIFEIIIGLGIFSSTGIYGADWKFLQTNTEGEFFYDAENITRPPANIVGVWLKIVYSGKFKEQEDLTHLNYTIGLWEINCQNKKVCLLSSSHYSKEGEVSPPQIWLSPDWRSMSPGTVMDALYKELCK